MGGVRQWLPFTLYAVGGALVTIFVFDYLSASYDVLQEPWFFIFVIVAYSAVVSVLAGLHGEEISRRRDGVL